jgi:type I restriction enzyme M protein
MFNIFIILEGDMDKQVLARTIWSTVEDLRGNIEAYTYKDYILGLLFYKFITDQEYDLLNKELGMEDEEIYQITEADTDLVDYCKDNLGYFVSPNNFYRKWLDDIYSFSDDNLVKSLGAFNDRNLGNASKHVFKDIFDNFGRNLSSLAPTSNERTKILRKLILAIKDIPTVNTEYDVLGYVYEYLISQFSAGAGKKSGEFFTPAEVSTVIARIVAHNLKDRQTVEVFDPTAGSGSLLLAVGHAFERIKHTHGKVKYYYQELVKGTYNMCRQNLVMRGVMPSNMVGRHGDTLDLDYPYFSDEDPDNTYNPVFVDAVVANPPYSQKYDPEIIKDSPRFAEYGLPPASKADYAFLLHGLYHLKSDGVQVIVLPHGVLFRNDEADIRTKLIKKHQIEAIIGLPANVFFGTGIPTCLLILKKTRAKDDILFIDASKGFVKAGNKNKLREADVQKIVDAYIGRKDIDKFARLVSYEEIAANDFNLNISRYINSEEDPEKFDAFGLMNGSIPKKELEEKFTLIWHKFPSLYGELFEGVNDSYVLLKVEDIIQTINDNKEVKEAKETYKSIIDDFIQDLKSYIFDNILDLDLANAQFEIKDKLFDKLRDYKLIDNYKAYQEFYTSWDEAELDLEAIHQDGLEACKQVVEITKIKKVKNKEVTAFDHWEGRILPFDLVQEVFLKKEKDRLEYLENRNTEIKGEIDNFVSILDEEDANKVLNDKKDAFVMADVKNELDQVFQDIDTPQIAAMNLYIELLDNKATKEEKLNFMANHKEVAWEKIEKNKDGTVGKGKLNAYYKEVQASHDFEEDSLGYILTSVLAMKDEESNNNKEIKELELRLQEESVKVLENLTEEEIYELLEIKWLSPIEKDLKDLMAGVFQDFENDLKTTIDKYGRSLAAIEKEEDAINQELKSQLLDLTGSDSDLAGIAEFIKILED